MRRLLLLLAIPALAAVSANSTYAQSGDCRYLQSDSADGRVPVVCGVETPAPSARDDSMVVVLSTEVARCLDALGLEGDRSRINDYKFLWANEIFLVPTKPQLIVGYTDRREKIIYIRSYIPYGNTVRQVVLHEMVHALLDEPHSVGNETAYLICSQL